MHFLLYALFFFVAWFISYYLRWRSTSKNLPPGPMPIPIFGNILQIKFPPMHETFDEWRKKYGEIVSAYLGNRYLVILNTADIARETLIKQGDNFAGRPNMEIFNNITGGKPQGYALTEGQVWKEQRRHALHVLRDFGLGRRLQEEKIEIEIQELFDEIRRLMKGAKVADINLQMPIKYAVVNIIYNILFGKRFTYNDRQFNQFQDIVNKNITYLQAQIPMEFLPFLKIFKKYFKFDETRELADIVDGFMREQIKEHRDHMESGSYQGPPTDFTYAYIEEMKRRQSDPDQSTTSFNEDQLSNGLFDIFSAGFETTATTLSWFVLYMVKHPDIQDKMRNEIERETSGVPAWADRVRMPFSMAVIAETQRYANIAPEAMFHRTFEDTKVRGYDIPANSLVAVNLWSIMRDPQYFKDPETFNPHRFIDSNGGFIEKQDALMPFSVGKRSCLGEGLARMELFMFATAFVHAFEFSEADSGPPDMTPNIGIVLGVKPYVVKVRARY